MVIKSLQAARAVAALAVVAHHAGAASRDFIGEMPELLNKILVHGYLGVDFFFVLSGFIIYHTNHIVLSQPGWSSRYIESRLIRIYIPYLPIGIVVAFAYLVFPFSAGAQRPWGWLPTLTLLPVETPALSVAWTLQHEIFFYALAWLILKTKLVLISSLLWASIILLAAFLGYQAIPLSLINLEFLFGILIAWCYSTGRLTNHKMLIALGLVSIVTFFIIDDRRVSVIFGLGLACFLLPLIRAEAIGKIRIASGIMLLGEGSYAIYLIHQPIISALVRALAFTGLSALATLGLLIAISTIAGIIYHCFFERPTITKVKRFLSGFRSNGMVAKA